MSTGIEPRGDVVITGVALEAPGGAESLDDLWDVLEGDSDVLGPLPRDRGWDVDGLLSLGDEPGWHPVPDSCGLIPGATEWDAPAFGVSPREADLIHPHQRVAARCAERALRSAGTRPGDPALHDAGVAVAALHDDYGPDFGVPGPHHGDLLLGKSASAISGRVAHHLDLRGPAVTLDAGCAGFLAALDVAVALIRAGSAPAMLVGGVSVLCTPGMIIEFSRLGALSPDGHCRPFSAGRSGTAWAEGCVMALVESAESARSAGRETLAVVHGVATAHGGARTPMQVPNGKAHAEAIGRCIASAGVGAGDVDVVEAHGTGTRVGDPIELRALDGVYGRAAAAAGRLVPVRSAKSHFGHAQAAASGLGLCALLAGALRGRIPRHLHDGAPADPVGSPGCGLYLAGAAPWPARGGWRRAGLSALGIGGTATHAILGFPEEIHD